jgi:DNA-binding transcriptional MocR family regulator
MSLRRRKELVSLAREYDALVITDDVYDFLQWPSDLSSQSMSLEKAVLPRIVDVDRYLDGGAERDGADGFGNAVSNGSFSKICGPGLRTGWCEGTAKLAYGVSQTLVPYPISTVILHLMFALLLRLRTHTGSDIARPRCSRFFNEVSPLQLRIAPSA